MDDLDDVSVLPFEDPRYKKPICPVLKEKNYQNPAKCDHHCTLWTDAALRTVECGKCGAMLDPIECLYMLQRRFQEREWMYEAIREHKRKERERAVQEQEKRDARLKKLTS